MPGATIVHVPTPTIGPGSTVLTVINDLLVEGMKQGTASTVLLEPWRAERIDRASVTASPAPRFPSGRWLRLALAADEGAARTIGRRPAVERMYRSVLHDRSTSPSSSMLLHDGSFAIGGIRPARDCGHHGPLFLYSHIPIGRGAGRRELRSTLARVDGVICVSEFLAERLTERLGPGIADIHVVHNGIDTELFSPGADELDGECRILWIGRASPEKGAHELLRALALLTHRNWTLSVVGASWFSPGGALSPYEQELRNLAKPLGGRVEFLGFMPHDEVAALMRTSQIFCFPSLWDEPFGLSLLEAMGCGLACVASPRGGIPEVGGDAVLYADPEDHHAFASRIDDFLCDAALARTYGDRARERAETLSTERQFHALTSALALPSPDRP